ncbi:hypothetical protein BTR19_24220 [Pseudomonas fluorescens]|nr:hypothetical protein BTR19_24220 [Pseudomonas fluorescens]
MKGTEGRTSSNNARSVKVSTFCGKRGGMGSVKSRLSGSISNAFCNWARITFKILGERPIRRVSARVDSRHLASASPI